MFDETIEYEVRRSDDATQPRIDVDIHGVVVVLPTGSDVDPHGLVEENSRWLLKKWRVFQGHRNRAPSRSFEEGEVFPYRGEDLQLAIDDVEQSHVEPGAFVLASNAVDGTSVRSELEALYRREARSLFQSRIDYFAAEMAVEPGKLELRNQRTRWASCSPQKTLSFNWRLVMAPDDVIDYVVVHELAHLREKNHTRNFWSIVGNHVPDYESHVDWLTENSSRLIFTEDDL
ncbi:M48 family metallopeptidase [Halobaculum magnesiiphilum]|uniref:M48 family metallopeptidase n=1 Tax=Halobaculum magnesiiphilum TaxID=1017351 RepID=UPI001CED3060|nr:SprT family zinc-dependent metalloprotease [Halobaculum magnesiiphilum]